MEYSSSAPNERVWRITRLAKLSFNHLSVVITADGFQFLIKKLKNVSSVVDRALFRNLKNEGQHVWAGHQSSAPCLFSFRSTIFDFDSVLDMPWGPVLTKEKQWIQCNFLNWIEVNLNLIGRKMNNQKGISIVGRWKFDSIQLTKKSKKISFELDWIEIEELT